MLVTKNSPVSSHQCCSHKCHTDRQGGCWDAWAGVTVWPITTGVTHGVDCSFEVGAVHLDAVFLRHAAPGRQGTVVAVTTICLETQLMRRALGHNKLKPLLLLHEGAVEAEQVAAKQRGEKVEPQHSNIQELQHVLPAWKGNHKM